MDFKVERNRLNPEIAAELKSVKTPKKLLKKYLVEDTSHLGPMHYCIRDTGIPVYVIVGYAKAEGTTIDSIADSYRIPRSSVEAALGFYRRNRWLIDAKLTDQN